MQAPADFLQKVMMPFQQLRENKISFFDSLVGLENMQLGGQNKRLLEVLKGLHDDSANDEMAGRFSQTDNSAKIFF